MVKEVNPNIHVNERDYPVDGHRCDDPEKAKLVKKLAVLITDSIPRKLPGKMKENHMDFWILDRLLTKDEVKFMLSFKQRRVGLTTKELAERNAMSEEEAQKIIDHLVWIGIIEQNRDNADQHIQYWIPKWVVGSGEYMVEHKTLCDTNPEVATMFNLAPQEPLELAAKLVPPGGAGIGMHVIPVEQAIDPKIESASVEHLSHWINNSTKLCKMVCACRKAQRVRGEGVGDIEGMMCIGLNDIAEFLVRHGANPDRDLPELWRRMVFSLMISNTDDHLRNHGFVWREGGWRLSPAYDLNPDSKRPGALSLELEQGVEIDSIEVLVEAAEYFRLTPDGCDRELRRVRDAVGSWREVAKRLGIARQEQELMAQCFRVL